MTMAASFLRNTFMSALGQADMARVYEPVTTAMDTGIAVVWSGCIGHHPQAIRSACMGQGGPGIAGMLTLDPPMPRVYHGRAAYAGAQVAKVAVLIREARAGLTSDEAISALISTATAIGDHALPDRSRALKWGLP